MVAQTDFDYLARDLLRQAYDDTLDVFRTSVILYSIQKAQVGQAQQLFDALIGSLWARTIDGGVGAQLDVIGRIVGLYPRPTRDAAAIVYFAPDMPPEAAVDWAPAYVTGAPLAGQVPIGDVDYRLALRVKIAKNHVKYGSPAELQYFARVAFGATISVKNVGLSEVEITIAPGTSPQTVAAILSERTDETADHQFSLPLPTTVRIARVVFREPIAFSPDGPPEAGVDIAPIGVSYYV